MIFFNDPLVAAVDLLHSGEELRFYALGRTDSERHLFVAFTIRESLIRVISVGMSKELPKFANEDEERRFWSENDSADYVDWDRARRIVLPRLKPSQKKISLRLPAMMLAELKRLANKRDVPYQSLLKVFLAERLEKELRRPRGK